MRKVLLASASPRRAQLIRQIATDVVICPQDVEEKSSYVRPYKLVCDLARKKVGDLPTRKPHDIVVGSDTVVWCNSRVYGKPHTPEVACQYLRELAGRWHSVYTGVHVALEGRSVTFWDRADVKFAKLSDEQIRAYVATQSPLDKAGAYGIQDHEVVERYRGCYETIVGLPTERLRQAIDTLEKEL